MTSIIENKFFIQTFGCQMNKLDSELAAGLLIENGYKQAANIGEANIILYYTCSVREHAEHKVYSHIGSLKARKLKEPGLIIGVLGCMAQKDGKKIFKITPHVSLVCGTKMFHKLPEILKSVIDGEEKVIAVNEDEEFNITRTDMSRGDKFQAFVSIMRGCDNYCSYCIVPYVRGREISRDVDDIVNEVAMLAKNGCKEVTLLGQNVNSYGKSIGKGVDFAVLLNALGEVGAIERIRFLTSHPKDMSRGILEAMLNNSKICKYLHLPAQSGSDRILKNMNRKYTSGYYRDLIKLARDIMPAVAISSDFIVGFPGEGSDDFQETVKLVEDVRFFNCFIFKYSPRSGTQAYKLNDDVPEKTKKERNKILLDLQENISRDNNRTQIGKCFNVFVEKLNKKNFTHNQENGAASSNAGNLFGRTEYNHIMVFDGNEDQIGKIVKVEATGSTDLTLFGRQLEAEANSTLTAAGVDLSG